MTTPPVNKSSETKIVRLNVERTESKRMGRKFVRQGAQANLLASTDKPTRSNSGKIQDINDLLGIGFAGHDCTDVKK